MTLEQRFWAKVNRAGPMLSPYLGPCWVWTAATSDGYGLISVNGSHKLAHRVVFRLMGCEIPAGMQVDHLCRIRHCVNPAHLEPVTPLENVHRSGHGVQTHCRRGHPLSGENLHIRPNGRRRCRACERQTRRLRKGRKT